MVQGYLRGGLWKQSYLLEFYKKEGGELTNSFCFGVPPEVEEITLGMRKSETKTFGGLIIDDYGCDNAYKMTLQGSSINNELRRIYSPIGQDKYLTGEQEIYAFKQFIEDCKKKENLDGVMYLYDLSKYKRGKEDRSINIFSWQVFPGDLKIKRSKEKPFTYTYSIDFTAIPTDKKGSFDGFEEEKEVLTFEQTLDELLLKIDYLVFSQIRGGVVKFEAQTIDKINNLRDHIKNTKAFGRAIVKGTIREIQNALFSIIDLGNVSISLYHETVGSVVPLVMEVVDYFALMGYDITKKLVEFVNNVYSVTKKEFYIPKGTFDTVELTADKIMTEWDKVFLGAYKEVRKVTKFSKSILPNQLEIKEKEEERKAKEKKALEDRFGSRDEFNAKIRESHKNENNDVTMYGAKFVSITDGMSFERLAVENYGDVNRKDLIARFNNASNVEELIREGRKGVFLPILEKKESNSNNKIIGFSSQRDAYGVDIALDENGNMEFDSARRDFKLVRGKRNLSQAILNRLKENINKRFMLQYYGIKQSLPDAPNVANAYILSSIIRTLNMEPRIKAILGVSFKGEGDVLRIDIDYQDIAGSVNTLQGVV